MTRVLLCLLVISNALAASKPAATNHEQSTSRHFDSIKKNPELLLAFLREIPKGGDLHNHLFGAVYAESWIDFAAADGLCVDHTTSILIAPPCDPCEKYSSKPAVACAYRDQVLYNQIIDAWSMRNWTPGSDSGHDHFFASFDKFGLAARLHTGNMLAEVASRAAEDRLQYLELMHTADDLASAQLGAKLGWNDDLKAMRDRLLDNGLKDVINTTRQKLDRDEEKMRSDLRCSSASPDPGCSVVVRYLYQVLRGLPKEQVFAQILLGFELAQSDPRFVGLNLVMPEDWYVPMHDFELHMAILDYLHSVYPNVHISLHADELAEGLVPPERLRFHIRDSIEKGHAERIGHGVAVMHENNAVQLLQSMAQKNIAVEICLTSNDLILGVSGDRHPFSTYRQYGVPLALATDDEGVSRSNMTAEYVRAAETYDLSYGDLKRLARQSLEHSFLPGASLWANTKQSVRGAACATDAVDHNPTSSACKDFLDKSERARQQWRLEQQFAKFESNY